MSLSQSIDPRIISLAAERTLCYRKFNRAELQLIDHYLNDEGYVLLLDGAEYNNDDEYATGDSWSLRPGCSTIYDGTLFIRRKR